MPSTLSQLNTYGNTTLTYTELRLPKITFDRPTPTAQTASYATNQGHAFPIGINITEIVAPTTLLAYIQLFFSNGAVATFNDLPTGYSVTSGGGYYTVSNIASADDWNRIKNVTVTTPNNYKNNYTYTATIGYTGGSKVWTTTVTNTQKAAVTATASMTVSALKIKGIVSFPLGTFSLTAIGQKGSAAFLTTNSTLTLVPKTFTGIIANLATNSTLAPVVTRILKFNAGLTATASLGGDGSSTGVNFNYFRIQINVASNLLTWSANINMASTQTITVFWGDSTSTNYTSNGAVAFGITHTYSTAGLYDITVKCKGYQLGNFQQSSSSNITRIYDWGLPQPNSISMHRTMQHQPQLTNVPNYLPASNISNCDDLLAGCASLNDANVSSWNVSTVTRMAYMFSGCTQFNRSLANWDVSNVIDMQGMFLNALTFNQDISGWDVHLIATEPMQFDQGCNNWIEARKPVWGTYGS